MPTPSYGLTVKQRLLIKYISQGMSGAEAARRAGYSKKAAKEIASETLTNPNVRAVFLSAMEKAGITDERLARVMDDGLNATKAISATTAHDAGDRTVDFVDVPDHHARHKFFNTAVDIKGLKAAQKIEARVSNAEDFLNGLDADADSEGEGEPPAPQD